MATRRGGGKGHLAGPGSTQTNQNDKRKQKQKQNINNLRRHTEERRKTERQGTLAAPWHAVRHPVDKTAAHGAHQAAVQPPYTGNGHRRGAPGAWKKGGGSRGPPEKGDEDTRTTTPFPQCRQAAASGGGMPPLGRPYVFHATEQRWGRQGGAAAAAGQPQGAMWTNHEELQTTTAEGGGAWRAMAGVPGRAAARL